MRIIRSARWLLVLLSLISTLSISLGEETTDNGATADADTDAATDAVGTNSTSNPTNQTLVEDDGEATTDDGNYVGDLLPGLEDQKDSFVTNYIMGDPQYYRYNYTAPHMVPRFNRMPRFGHSDDFAKLLGDSPDDYFLGLLFIGTFICSIYVFWGIIIFVLKCIGPKHVGVLAGFPFRQEGKKSLMGRMALSVSAWGMIVATIVLITKGMTEMQGLSDTVGMTVFDIKTIEAEVQQMVTTLQVVAAKTTPIRDELVDFLKRDICPLEPGSDTEDMVRDVGEDTYDAMTELDDFIEGYLNDVESGVNQTGKFTDRIDGIVQAAQFTNNWKVTAVLFPYFIVPAFILVAVCMGWFDVFNEGFYTFITWVILPLLVIMTIGAIIAAGWMTIFLQANTDLCMPKPEVTILSVLDTVDLESDSGSASKDENGPSGSFFYDVMVFYTHQCEAPNPWQFLEGHYADLARGRNILGEFIRSIEDTTLAQLSQECGHEYGPIVALLIQLQDLISLLAQTSIRALNLMSCRNIVPLYTVSVYEATCTQAPIGLTWCLSCAIVIAFCGMVSIMFRGAYYPIDYYYYDEKDLYPTEDESNCDMDNHLADNECNDLILQQQEDQCHETMEIMQEEDHFDVYRDDSAPKGDTLTFVDSANDTNHNVDYATISEFDNTTLDNTLLTNPLTDGGELYSIGTYEDGTYNSMTEESMSLTYAASRESC